MSISNSIIDRDFDSFGGKEKATTYRRVLDHGTQKIAQLKQYEMENIDVSTLGIIRNNRGIFLTTNDGSLLYKN